MCFTHLPHSRKLRCNDLDVVEGAAAAAGVLDSDAVKADARRRGKVQKRGQGQSDRQHTLVK